MVEPTHGLGAALEWRQQGQLGLVVSAGQMRSLGQRWKDEHSFLARLSMGAIAHLELGQHSATRKREGPLQDHYADAHSRTWTKWE